MKTFCFSVAVILLVALASNAVLADPPLHPFVSDSGRFSVLMPASPKYSESELKTSVGIVHEHLYSAEQGPIAVDAEYSQLPTLAALFGGRSHIYRKVVAEFLQREPSTELGYDNVQLDAYRGRVMTYENSRRYGKLWMLLISRRLYVLNVSVPRDYPDRSLIDRCLESFQPLYRDQDEAPDEG